MLPGKIKRIKWLLIIAFFILLAFLLANRMPKYVYLIPVLILLLTLNSYLLTKIKISSGKKKHPALLLWLMKAFVVLPSIHLVVFFLASLLYPLQFWHPVIRTYLLGFVPVLFLIQVFITSLYLIADFINRVVNLINRKRKAAIQILRLTTVLNTSAWVLGIIAFVIFLYGMIFTAFDYQIKEVEIRFKELPAEFDGLKIVQISDLHLGSFYGAKPMKIIKQKIDAQNPDLVFLTGDIVNYATAEAFPFKDIMTQIKAPMGVYAIMGNHDYGEYVRWKSKEEKYKNLEELYRFYEQTGWKLLRNEHLCFTRNNAQIVLAGVENWGVKSRYPRHGNLKQALKGVDSTLFTILLSHDPSHWEEIVTEKYPQINLTFSGHTHAMQMGFIHNGKEWSPANWFYNLWGGLYENEHRKEQYLYINRGTGMIGVPARIGLGPEITVITLRKE